MTRKSIEDISNLTANERNAISEFVNSIREKFGAAVKEIILFGSKVRGDSGKESKI